MEKESSTLSFRRLRVSMSDSCLPIRIQKCLRDSSSIGCELHWHEELEFYYVKKGAVSLLCNGLKSWLYPGDVGFVNWCQLHRGDSFLDGTEYYIVQIGVSLFENESLSVSPETWGHSRQESLLLLYILQHDQFPTVSKNSPELNSILDSMILESEKCLPGYPLKLKASVYNLLVHIIRQADTSINNISSGSVSHTPELLTEILSYLSVHYAAPEEVTLSALSRNFNLSPSYLCKMFKNHTSLTITSYVNELRCSRASVLIQEGASLESAATQTGFLDYNYFSRVFRKTVGISPSDFRKKNLSR